MLSPSNRNTSFGDVFEALNKAHPSSYSILIPSIVFIFEPRLKNKYY